MGLVPGFFTLAYTNFVALRWEENLKCICPIKEQEKGQKRGGKRTRWKKKSQRTGFTVSVRKALGEMSPDLSINYCRLSWATATILAGGKPSRKAVVSLNSLASSSMPAVCPGAHPLLRRKGQKARLDEGPEAKTKGNWNEKQISIKGKSITTGTEISVYKQG